MILCNISIITIIFSKTWRLVFPRGFLSPIFSPLTLPLPPPFTYFAPVECVCNCNYNESASKSCGALSTLQFINRVPGLPIYGREGDGRNIARSEMLRLRTNGSTIIHQTPSRQRLWMRSVSSWDIPIFAVSQSWGISQHPVVFVCMYVCVWCTLFVH